MTNTVRVHTFEGDSTDYPADKWYNDSGYLTVYEMVSAPEDSMFGFKQVNHALYAPHQWARVELISEENSSDD